MCVPVFGLTSAVGSATAQDEEAVLTAGFLQWVDSLNPNIGLSDAAYVYYGFVYDYPYTIENDLVVRPNIATGWTIVPESDPELVASGEPYGSVWEYTLSENGRWHDGEPVTIDDFVFSVNLHALNYEIMWACQPYGYFIQYAEAIDQNTMRVHFYDRETDEPVPAAFGSLLGTPLMPKHKLGDKTASWIAFDWTGVYDGEEFPIVGTGPFTGTDYIWDEYNEGNSITLVKSPGYHWELDRDMEVSFDKLVLKFYDDASAMLLALKRGDIDIAQFPPQTYLALKEDVESGAVSNIEVYDGLRITGYWTEIAINYAEAGPNQVRLDPAVRQALAMATDKDYIVDTFYAGLAEPGSTLISPINTKWHYEPTADERYDFNKDAARALLEAAGYVDLDDDGVRDITEDSLAVQEGWSTTDMDLTIHMMIRREYPEEKEIADYLEQVWAEIGVDMNYDVIDEVTLGTEVYKYQYDTMIWYWSSDVDPHYQLFCSSSMAIGGWNDNAYANESYDESFWMSVKTLDDTQRKVYTDESQRINYLDAHYIILAYPYQTYGWRTDTFTGWGDWDETPALSFDNFWSAPQLMFELEPIVDDEPPPDGDGDGDSDILMYAGIGAAIAVVVAAVAIVLMMKKKGGGKKEKESTSPLGE